MYDYKVMIKHYKKRKNFKHQAKNEKESENLISHHNTETF